MDHAFLQNKYQKKTETSFNKIVYKNVSAIKTQQNNRSRVNGDISGDAGTKGIDPG